MNLARLGRKFLSFFARGWEAAQTTRLNSAHWAEATGETVNQALSMDLATLRDRCEHEANNNPILSGVVDTFAGDLVGPKGPTLQFQSDDIAWNAAAERAWKSWWCPDRLHNPEANGPDMLGQLLGPDLLELAFRALLTSGDWLWQLTRDERDTGDAINLRIRSIHTRRMQSGYTAQDLMGVELDDYGRPVKFIVEELNEVTGMSKLTEIPAADAIHGFKTIEPGQVRGVPWLAPCLPVAADLRDYDDQVMDAARAAADFAVMLYTDHEDASFVEYDDEIAAKRRRWAFLPPHYKAEQLKPEQPHTQYVDYRLERHAEIGRPFSMPSVLVRLDSRHSNLSSARGDTQAYTRKLRRIQAWAERVALNRILGLVLREMELAQIIPPRPEGLTHTWTWPAVPNIDPHREATAQDVRMNNTRTLDFYSACAEEGLDGDEVLEREAREMRRRDELGLPPRGAGIAEYDPDPEYEEENGR